MEIAPLSDPLFYALAVPACLIVGISKGGFGGAFGMLGVPMMALAISPVQAAAILLPILCAMDLFGLAAYRRRADFAALRLLLPAAMVGIAVGALTFRFLNDDAIRLLLGAIAAGFALNHWLGRAAAEAPARPRAAFGGIAGAVSGFTSFVAHAGGPPVQAYLLPRRMDKTLYVGTTVWFFTAVNYVKLVPYAYLGQFTLDNLGTSLVLAPLAPIGIWLGVAVHKRVPEALFYRLAWGFLFLAGVKLMHDGAAGLGWL